MPENRTNTGQFAKGATGNPGGRPKNIENFRQLARDHSDDALLTLIGIMMDKKAKDVDRIRASEIIVNRAWGLPTQAITGADPSDPDSHPLTIETIVNMLSRER